MKTVILDYGMGNLRSVQKACEVLGFEAEIRGDFEGADKLILPGVGAFGAAMANLSGMVDGLRGWAKEGRPLMGICLGQQLLFDVSEEFGETGGLGIVPGRVKYFERGGELKVPQMGWNALEVVGGSRLMKGVDSGSRTYFVHSLYCECEDMGDVAAWTEYGVRYASAVERGNVWGCQFHPEKSGDVGLRILGNFLSA